MLKDWHPANSKCPVCDSTHISRQDGLYFSLRVENNPEDSCVYAVPIKEKALIIAQRLLFDLMSEDRLYILKDHKGNEMRGNIWLVTDHSFLFGIDDLQEIPFDGFQWLDVSVLN